MSRTNENVKPSIVKIRVIEARHLPVMDRATGSTDGFVIVRFAGRDEQTNVQRKTLTPRWDEDFRFDVQDDAALQNEPLLFRVMDSDSFGASNPIGACHVSLTPLLTKDAVKGQEFQQQTFTSGLSGWFPIFDTLEGVRGELYIVVKVQNIADENPYSESSSVVEIYSSSWLDPEVIAVERVMGLVEELVVDEDPEYSWSNNFHSARLTNDARLQLMYKLSMAVRRLVGKKALELGANAVIGYQQHFDIEGNSGMVCRGYGTACVVSQTRKRRLRRHRTSNDGTKAASYITVMGSRTLPVFSDGTSTSSLHRADETVYGVVPHPFLLDPPKASPQQQYLNTTFSSTDATILTMHSFPVNLRLQLGGIVAAKSVKYLGRLNVFKADRETRDQWWAELRAEVKSHASSLLCNYVVGYTESCVICDDVCVLSATGTAAVLKESKPVWKVERDDDETDEEEQPEKAPTTEAEAARDTEATIQADSVESKSEKKVDLDDTKEEVAKDLQVDASTNEIIKEETTSPTGSPRDKPKEKSPRLSVVLLDEEDASMLVAHSWSRKKRRKEIRRQRRRVLRATLPCSSMHVPFKQNAAPFANMRLVPCGVCKNKWVPEIMLSTIEPPPMLPVTGGGTLVEARVCKSREKLDTRENDAGALGEQLVFMEIELHRQLMLKLKVMGMNAAFSLRSQINFAGDLIVGVVSATAIHTPALPPPALLRIKRNIAVVDTEDRMLMNLQRRIEVLAEENRERLLKIAVAEADSMRRALRAAKANKNQAFEQEAADLKWRKIGESIAKDAALVAVERLKAVEDDNQASTTEAAAHDSEKPSIGTHDAANVAPPGGTIQSKASGWFARRRRNQDAADLESSRWQGRRLRANLGLGTVRQAITLGTASQQPSGGTGGKSPMLMLQKSNMEPESISPLSGDVLPPTSSPGLSEGTASPKPSEPAMEEPLPPLQQEEPKPPRRKKSSIVLVDPALFRAQSGLSSTSSSSSSSSSSSDSSSDDESSSSDDDMDEEEAETLLNELRGDKNSFVVEIDDETDEDVMAVLFDRQTPPDVALCTSNTLPQNVRKHEVADCGTFVSAVRTCTLDKGRATRLNLQVASLFHQTYALLALKVARYSPCVIAGVRVQLSIPMDEALILTLTATVSRLRPRNNVQGDALIPADLRDVPLGLPPLLSSVFHATLENSPGLLPNVDQSPTIGMPSRSPTGVGPLLALKKTIWGVSTGIFKSFQVLRSVSRSSTGDSQSGNTMLLQQPSLVTNDGSLLEEPREAATSPTTIAHLLGISTNLTAAPVGADGKALDGKASDGKLVGANEADSARLLPLGESAAGAVAPSLEDEAMSFREPRLVRSPFGEAPTVPLVTSVYRPNVVLTALEYVPGARITRYLGRINIHLIKESAVVREGNGLSSFYYPFMLQAHAIARAHAEALGGNAILSFRLVRRDSGAQKNQTYNLISLSGDAVLVTFLAGGLVAIPPPAGTLE